MVCLISASTFKSASAGGGGATIICFSTIFLARRWIHFSKKFPWQIKVLSMPVKRIDSIRLFLVFPTKMTIACNYGRSSRVRHLKSLHIGVHISGRENENRTGCKFSEEETRLRISGVCSVKTNRCIKTYWFVATIQKDLKNIFFHSFDIFMIFRYQCKF